MPKTAAATVTEMASLATRNVKGGQVVHLSLVFDGVPFVPADLLTALTTQYGAGKVSSDTDTVAHANYRFRVIP